MLLTHSPGSDGQAPRVHQVAEHAGKSVGFGSAAGVRQGRPLGQHQAGLLEQLQVVPFHLCLQRGTTPRRMWQWDAGAVMAVTSYCTMGCIHWSSQLFPDSSYFLGLRVDAERVNIVF